jgi:hypothetical protein
MLSQSMVLDESTCRKSTTWKRGHVLVLVLGGLLASAVPSDVLAARVYTLQEAMANGIDIRLTSEGCFAGECVSVYAVNRNDETVNLKISKGDVLLNKHEDEQNLVVANDLTLVIPAGQAVEDRLSTLCLDAAEAGPSEGRVFDVAANLREWPAETPAPMLLAALEEAAGQGLERSARLQEVTWKLTDDHQVASIAGQDLLRSIGMDPDGTAPSFPHLRNPNRSSSDTGYVASLVEAHSLPERVRPTNETFVRAPTSIGDVASDIHQSREAEDGTADVGIVPIVALGGAFVVVLLGAAAVRNPALGTRVYRLLSRSLIVRRPSHRFVPRDQSASDRKMVDDQRNPMLRKIVRDVSMMVVLCSMIVLGCGIATVPKRSGSDLPRVAHTPALHAMTGPPLWLNG